MGVGFYADEAAVNRYQQHRHGGASSPNEVMEEPALMHELGDVTGLRILDLGCGDAAIAAGLLDAGATHYHGIDSSPVMVGVAQSRLGGRAAQIEQAPIGSFTAPPDSFDLIISRLALHYVENMDSVLQACAACVTPGGRLIITVLHPVLTSAVQDQQSGEPRTSWTVDDYFRPGPRTRSWLGSTVTWQHRTVEAYVRAVHSAGFAVTSLRECQPERPLFAGDEAEFARRERVPMFLLLAGTMAA